MHKLEVVRKLDVSIRKYFDSLKKSPKRTLSPRAERFWEFRRSATKTRRSKETENTGFKITGALERRYAGCIITDIASYGKFYGIIHKEVI